ncbi:2' O-ribose methyltransferase [Gnomoniopsis smithogilvyi]|uniref:rRNA methyltransferase 2, mitochondrial n=1 Tax=Gnomoniopsis smithogilvyi TaxID=1191159 RepID=A0A9W8Z1N1_9PEZI|nr:2' O-ribose methyltransferase [Gnomoniopsis smithogilvyi]
MKAALRAPPCGSALSERLITRTLSNLTLTTRPQPWTCPSCQRLPGLQLRASSSSSSSQWKSRQSRDRYARDAKVQGLKSRAAYKLLEMDAKYRLFRRNQTIIDLGYAPGSWSQVAVERTRPHGVVVGIDLIPAQPPRGVTSIQGDFLSPQVRKLARDVVVEQVRRKKQDRALERRFEGIVRGKDGVVQGGDVGEGAKGDEAAAAAVVVSDRPSYIDLEKAAALDIEAVEAETEDGGRMVDVVISDMSEPWPQTTGFMSNTLSNPYRRLMNTSGISFRDHAGSMTDINVNVEGKKQDLCYAALAFASENLKPNGHFVCKFYQGAEDKLLQTKLKKMFEHVHREKPDSSRKDSKEAYFVGLKRKGDVTLASIEGLSHVVEKDSTGREEGES